MYSKVRSTIRFHAEDQVVAMPYLSYSKFYSAIKFDADDQDGTNSRCLVSYYSQDFP